jgi:hypothetical protein
VHHYQPSSDHYDQQQRGFVKGGGMISIGVRIAVVLAILGAGALIQLKSMEIAKLKSDVAFQKQVVATLATRVVASEGRRATEIAQCTDSVAGLIERHKTELEQVSKATLAKVSLTGKCPPLVKNQPERKAAWDAILGSAE